ncbi:sugar-binding domain-containing protein [Persicobacter psychrovividus]|uniref:sugar-binding domain-containing protein n=1 Tax=Persicobacter psychrovividus TaxID=387638 RepID=UPI0030CA290B
MTNFFKQSIFFFLSFFLLSCSSTKNESSRVEEDFNFGWQFHLGDLSDAYTESFNTDGWESVRLPHDWSVQQEFSQEHTAGATGFLPGGVGWYRKHFTVPSSSKDKKLTIAFDGVYTNSEVWINGQHLGKRPYGYVPFNYDLTPYIKFGKDNVIAVKADRSAYIDCRWYPGSGIYRNVKLITTNALHIDQWGIKITTPEVKDDQALVAVASQLVNESSKPQSVRVRQAVVWQGKEVQESVQELSLDAGASKTVDQSLEVVQPELWSVDHPNLYELHTEVYVDEKLVDNKVNTFGIRTIRYDKDKGFFLNGKHTLIKGVCLHHDAGLVGAAVPDGVWRQRLLTLKEGGCNAIRTAHNPPSSRFLDLCDELGFLVQDEAFDEWSHPKDKKHNYNQQEVDKLTEGYSAHFEEWGKADLENMVRRDQNHPSIIMWSIGNEVEWTFPAYGASTGYWDKKYQKKYNYYFDEPPFSAEQIERNFKNNTSGVDECAQTAQNLAKWLKEIDTTRPVTANLVIPTVSNFSGYADALDIVGLSYRQSVYDYCHRNYPEMTFLGTENWTRYHEWKAVLDHEFIAGIFLWTGMDYMGESRSWPIRGTDSGLLDGAGFKKPSFYMFKALWSNEPSIYITTQTLEKSPYKWDKAKAQLIEREKDWAKHQKWGWQDVNNHWNYKAGEQIAVEVYTNQEAVELFCGGRSYGVQYLKDQQDHILKWKVPFEAGKIEARSVNKPQVKTALQTAKAVSKIELKVDKTELSADGYEVAQVVAQLVDADGVAVKDREQVIDFHVNGDVRALGVDNGDVRNVQGFNRTNLKTSQGRALMIVQSQMTKGKASISVSSDGLKSNTIDINIK